MGLQPSYTFKEATVCKSTKRNYQSSASRAKVAPAPFKVAQLMQK